MPQLACPFCGCDHADNPDNTPFPMPLPDGGECWVYRCGNPACFADVVGETPGDAMAKWNRRVAPQEGPERGLATGRREWAVRTLLAAGWRWEGGKWVPPLGPAM